jgi:NADH:ubiquinone oxidoreductase subunit E
MSKFSVPDITLYVCNGSKCSKRGGEDLYKHAKAFAKHYDGRQEIDVISTECTDRCKFAPVCSLQPGNTWLKEYSQKQVLKLLKQLADEA